MVKGANRLSRTICTAYTAAVLAGLLGACHGGEAGGGTGTECESKGDCRGDGICAYGRCRAGCLYDDDCDKGACVPSAEDPNRYVCTIASEKGCGQKGG